MQNEKTSDIRHAAEIAAWTLQYSDALIHSPAGVPVTSLSRFWKASISLQQEWNRTLTRWRENQSKDDFGDVVGSIEEIFCFEILTRTWCAILTACDQARGTVVAEPIARRVLTGHLVVRSTALELMNEPGLLPLRELLELDRLRRRAERWSDQLVGTLMGCFDVSDFAVDCERARDFADSSPLIRPQSFKTAWQMMMAGIRLAVPAGRSREPRRRQAMREVMNSILTSIPESPAPLAFDAVAGSEDIPPAPTSSPRDVSDAIDVDDSGDDAWDGLPSAIAERIRFRDLR